MNQKFSRTFGQPLEILHFFQLGQKSPFLFHKISISILLSSCAIIAPPHTFFDQPMQWQVWNDWKKAFQFSFQSFQTNLHSCVMEKAFAFFQSTPASHLNNSFVTWVDFMFSAVTLLMGSLNQLLRNASGKVTRRKKMLKTKKRKAKKEMCHNYL